jgi:hypothetical protein
MRFAPDSRQAVRDAVPLFLKGQCGRTLPGPRGGPGGSSRVLEGQRPSRGRVCH